MVFDRFGNRIGQGAGVPDTGRAAITDDLKAKLVQVLEETGRFVILGDDARAGRGGCFYPRLHRKATLDRISRKHTRGQHHGWIGCVGTARDRGDDDRAMTERKGLAFVRYLHAGLLRGHLVVRNEHRGA